MAITIPTKAPLSARYMERVEWTRTFTDYPSVDSWAVGANLIGPEKGKSFQVAGTDAGGGEWTFSFETVARAVGEYRIEIWATKSGEARTVLEFHAFELLPGALEGATDRDSSTHFSRMLALTEARLEGRLELDSENYSVSGRSLSRIPMSDLVTMQAYYQRKRRSELAALERGVRPGRRRRIVARFS